MKYYYNDFGWHSTAHHPERYTEIAPPTETAELKANWTGMAWVLKTYTAPVVPVAVADPRLWWVDVGPFKDRLGVDAMALGASTHDACKAVTELLNGRRYVDLKDPKTLQMLGLLQATAQPAANAMFAGSGPMTAAKILAITNTPTVDAERYIKGL